MDIPVDIPSYFYLSKARGMVFGKMHENGLDAKPLIYFLCNIEQIIASLPPRFFIFKLNRLSMLIFE
jgi:hypothetical protein